MWPDPKPEAVDNCISLPEPIANVDASNTSLKCKIIPVVLDIEVDWFGIESEAPVPSTTSFPSDVKTDAFNAEKLRLVATLA